MQLAAGHFVFWVEGLQVDFAVSEGHLRTGEQGFAPAKHAGDGGGAVFVGDVDLAAGEGHCADAVHELNAAGGGVDVQLAAGNRQLAGRLFGKPNACFGIDGHLGGVGDFQL